MIYFNDEVKEYNVGHLFDKKKEVLDMPIDFNKIPPEDLV